VQLESHLGEFCLSGDDVSGYSLAAPDTPATECTQIGHPLQQLPSLGERQSIAFANFLATSPLVKTAFFGEDANWGRIVAAVGYSGVEMDPDRLCLKFGHVTMFEKGLGLGAEQETHASEVLKQPEFTVTIDLGLGQGSAYYYTSDLTYDYVKINAAYRT
jgi:glutamate N-acetyltransferase/amino-acid N-acetyltransferase